ncbi:hypothetical protein I5M27_09175 [Adhaeribacter sp. BT258]|uniref:Lipoprotein n=1 Tax=Adhaeribacter terrigena TaxID=2793070 RepID=A0ABS1C1F0_9BACT|nr:hypothetical protein [Adhaeribacter terrigena]MBK0403155.1 hypothetical protein [Adhaeribacter terrigena]
MNRRLGILLVIHFLSASWFGCNKPIEKEGNEKEKKIDPDEIIITDVIIEKFENQRITSPSNENSNFLIKFQAAQISPNPYSLRTFKDSSCIDIGVELFNKGEYTGGSYSNTYNSDMYKTIFLSHQPVQFYYPVKFSLEDFKFYDSILYGLKFYRQTNDSIWDIKHIRFNIKQSTEGLQVKVVKNKK